MTRTWTAQRRAVCLVVDISGSMQGLAVALAAGRGGRRRAGGGERRREAGAHGAGVQRGTGVLQAQGVRRPPEELIAELVALRGYGTTDLAAGLREAATQLAGAVAGERLVVLLSDCLPTAGDELAQALAGVDRLHVLVPRSSAAAETVASVLAARGGGTAQPVCKLAEIGPALTRILG